jgi:cell division transport system permease protein
MIQFIRIFQTGCRNFMRNAWLSAAATGVMTLTLTIIVVSFISNLALTSTIKGVTDKIDVTVYLKPDVTETELDKFIASLKLSTNVISIEHVTKEQALASYEAKNKDNQQLLQALAQAGNVLPASLNIKARDPKKLADIATVINQPENKALLDPTAPQTYSGGRKATIDRIVSFSNFFKTGGLLLSILFVIISTLIIFNTIRMAIFTRRDEIEIMKLVGATKWFIRGPFIIEAILYGLIAAIIALLLSYSLLLGAGPKLSSYINVDSTIHLFRTYPAVIVLCEMLIGIAIGMLSSLLAMSRYLKI